jgi:hypothetical protein
MTPSGARIFIVAIAVLAGVTAVFVLSSRSVVEGLVLALVVVVVGALTGLVGALRGRRPR